MTAETQSQLELILASAAAAIATTGFAAWLSHRTLARLVQHPGAPGRSTVPASARPLTAFSSEVRPKTSYLIAYLVLVLFFAEFFISGFVSFIAFEAILSGPPQIDAEYLIPDELEGTRAVDADTFLDLSLESERLSSRLLFYGELLLMAPAFFVGRAAAFKSRRHGAFILLSVILVDKFIVTLINLQDATIDLRYFIPLTLLLSGGSATLGYVTGIPKRSQYTLVQLYKVLKEEQRARLLADVEQKVFGLSSAASERT